MVKVYGLEEKGDGYGYHKLRNLWRERIMELKKNEEKICERLARKIIDYDENEDGCYWGHILDIVEKTYLKGKVRGVKENEN